MGKDWKYIAYLLLLAAIFLFMFLSKDKQYDWTVTLAHEDKNPYGTFVLNELLPSAFSKKVETNYETFYEFKNKLDDRDNVLILATNFNPDKEDAKSMLAHVEQGGVIFVSSTYINGEIADTLGLRSSYNFEAKDFSQSSNDSSSIHLVASHFDTSRYFYFKKGNIRSYYYKADTSKKKSMRKEGLVIAANADHDPVAIKINHGKGYFIFCSTPLIFTNIYLLDHDNHALVSSLLSYLPDKKIYRTEYYQMGRMEAATPMRFILMNDPLRWAYYISIISVLLFIAFEAKRRQRPIPVIAPLENTTLEFVGTIGTLYYERQDHKAIATKKILFFLEALREKYNFSLPLHTEDYAKNLSLRTAVDEELVQKLVKLIRQIMGKQRILEEELTTLNDLIQKFWNK
ncbi:MAG: DUF4350 domain-containing protein [Bacteroidetes bacterium]|nr:DUF4350 domain-containing protein [Bacteroidota bacterium]